MNISPVNAALSAVQQATSSSSLTGQVGLKMLDNALDTSKEETAGLIKMMEQSVNPHIGSNFDMSV